MLHIYPNMYELVRSIELSIENRLITPTLILIYCGIDIMSSLTVAGTKDVQKTEFMKWTDKYLIPNLYVECNSEDIYAARCSVVHSMGSESSLSRKGSAKEIMYSWGDALHEELEESVRLIRGGRAIALKIEDLIDGFKKAISSFIDDIEIDQQLKLIVESRADKVFINLQSIK